MQPNIYIIFPRFLESREKACVGGVESYISALISMFASREYNIAVYQCAETAFTIDWLGGKVIGVEEARSNKDLVNYLVSHGNPNLEEDILLFATDF